MDGIVFDKDGTLFDFRRSWGAWAATMLNALAEDEAHARRMGRAVGYDPDTGIFEADSPIVAATNADIAERLVPHLPGRSAGDILDELNDMAAVAPMIPATDLEAVFGALRGLGLKLGLATNDGQRAARAHLAAHGVDRFFDFIAGADSGHGAKPGPGMLLAFAQSQGLDPARVAMVGDSAHDLVAGQAAGMVPVAVLTGIAGADELSGLAEVVLPDISHLPGWVTARRAG